MVAAQPQTTQNFKIIITYEGINNKTNEKTIYPGDPLTQRRSACTKDTSFYVATRDRDIRHGSDVTCDMIKTGAVDRSDIVADRLRIQHHPELKTCPVGIHAKGYAQYQPPRLASVRSLFRAFVLCSTYKGANSTHMPIAPNTLVLTHS